MEVLDILSAVFTAGWSLFTGVQVPGLGISFASWFLALLVIGISIKLVSYVFGFGGSGTGYRSGSGGKKHISEKRKGDEK